MKIRFILLVVLSGPVPLSLLGQGLDLYALAEPSESNPVVVRSVDRQLLITEAEYTAFREAEGLGDAAAAGPQDQVLQTLIDQHLMSLAAHEAGLARDPLVRERWALTEGIMAMNRLGDIIATEFLGIADPEARLLELAQRLFEEARIEVDGAAYERFLELAANLNREATLLEIAVEDQTSVAPKSYRFEVEESDTNRPLAWHAETNRVVSTGEVLQSYLTLPSLSRPRLNDQEVFADFLGQFFTESILFGEIARRALNEDTIVVAQTRRIMNHYLFVEQLERQTMQRAAAEFDARSEEETQAFLSAAYDQLDETYLLVESTGFFRTIDEVAESLLADLWSERVEELTVAYQQSLRAGVELIYPESAGEFLTAPIED